MTLSTTHRKTLAQVGALFAALFVCAALARTPYPRYEPTPPEIVRAMLNLAEVKPGDVVYDLGSGDGRIVIAAVKEFDAARAVGIELNAELVKQAEQNARDAGVSEKVRFTRADLYEADLSEATVVTLYLLPEVNLRLRPKLLRELKPGTRIISHSHNMGDWKPDLSVQVEADNGKRHRLHVWTVPAR